MRSLLVVLFVMAHHGVLAQPCQPLGWDAAFTRDLNALNSPAVTRSSQIVSDALYPLGIGVPAALYLSGVLNVFDDRCSASPNAARAGVQIGTTMAAATAITLGLKQAFDRKRPYQAYPDCITNRASDSDPSFPSGHSAGSAALATSLSLVYPQWYVIVPSVG
jgi:undecaprenyl-diphosphatase